MSIQASALANHDPAPRADRPLLYRFEANIGVDVIGVVPEGLRMTVSFDGRVTEGLLEGARVWGVDPFLLRRDGIGIIDAPKTISSGETHVYEYIRAYCYPPEGMEIPPLEALVEPGFSWPDVPFPIRGFSFFRAAREDLSFLNRVVATVEGSANYAKGRLVIETRRFA